MNKFLHIFGIILLGFVTAPAQTETYSEIIYSDTGRALLGTSRYEKDTTAFSRHVLVGSENLGLLDSTTTTLSLHVLQGAKVGGVLRAGSGIYDTALDTAYTNAVSRIVSNNTFLGVGVGGKSNFLTIDTTKYATSSVSGFLKFSDWVNFNSKQAGDATLTALAGLSAVQGDIIYATAADAFAVLNKDVSSTRYLSNTGGFNNPAWAQIDLSNGVTGDLPYANFIQATGPVFIGRQTATLGDVSALSTATVKTMLDLTGTNSGDVTLAGTPDYITIAGQVITRGLVDLSTDVTGDLPYANITQASGASKLFGRGSAAGAGDWEEITLGTGLTMSGTTLNGSAGGGSAGGWTNFTPRLYTTNVGDTVHVRTGAGDTTGTGLALFNNWGTSYLKGATNFGAALSMGGTSFMDASRNLSNIGTIGSGAIVSTGAGTFGGAGLFAANVGIGTSAANRDANVPAGSFALTIHGTTGADDGYIRFGNEVDGTWWSVGSDGGNSDRFSITRSGLLGSGDKFYITTGGNVTIETDQNATTLLTISNPNAGTSARAGLTLSNGAGAGDNLSLFAAGANYSGVASWADKGIVNSGSGLGGLVYNAQAGDHIWQAVTVEKMRLSASGALTLTGPLTAGTAGSSVNLLKGTTNALTVEATATSRILKLARVTSSTGEGYLGTDATYALIVEDGAFNDVLTIAQTTGNANLLGSLIVGGIITGNAQSAGGLTLSRNTENSGGAGITSKKSRGSLGSPTVISANDVLFQIRTEAYVNGAYRDQAQYTIEAVATIGATFTPTQHRWWVTNDAGVSSAGLTLSKDGNLIITGDIKSDSSVTIAERSGTPTTPATGYGKMYWKADGKLYGKNDAGAEYDLTAGGGSGITTLNTLTNATQTFATGTAGTDFAISSVTSTHTFNLPTASAANRGALSSADWTTFNNKQAAGSYITALTSDVTATGPGSVAATIANDAVTLAKMANVATGTVFYRKTAATGDPEVQTLATLKTDLAVGDLVVGDQISSVNSITTEGNFGVPVIVDVVSSDNQSSITATNISSSTATGLYRISVYLETDVTDIAGSTVAVGVRWEHWDGTSLTESTSTVDLSGANNYTQETFFVNHTGAGSVSIQYLTTTYTGVGTYDLRITAERIN